MLEQTDYALAAEAPNIALILKEFCEAGKPFHSTLRLQASSDESGFKNSILPFLYVKTKEYRRFIRKKESLINVRIYDRILHKSETAMVVNAVPTTRRWY